MSPRNNDEWKTRVVAGAVLAAVMGLCTWAIAGVHSLEVRQEGSERDTQYIKDRLNRIEGKLDRLLSK